jgi:signal transduction histidine kinase
LRHVLDTRTSLKEPSLVERIVSRYGVAAGLVSAALLLSFLLQPVFPDAFVFLFLAAVMTSAWFGRAGPGLAAVFLSMAAVAYFFIPPLYSLRINRREVSYFVTFVLSAVVVSWFSSKRKHFEQTLKEKNIELEEKNIELEKALLAKDDFLASMSHELRTPLNAIIGFTGTLLMKLPGPLTDEQNTQLQTIRSSGKHLLSLINDLLDLTKIASGKITLHLEPVVCQTVVQEVRTTLLPLAKRKGLNFNVTVPEKELVVTTDQRALRQILLNLTGNAIKFTDRGEVRIVLGREEHDGKSWTQFSIHDTGTGISPQDQGKLFQAFARVGSKSLRRREGAGLGLHLSQKLAHLIKAEIHFKSEYGIGSTFTLSVPESELSQR